MTCWLLDTNVLSELRRQRPEPKVVAFVGAQSLDSLVISSIRLAEIRFGIELLSDAWRRAELTDWLTHKVRPMFDQRILPINGRRHVEVAALGRGRPQGRSQLLAV